MTNEINPFEISISISKALNIGILKIGKCDLRIYHTNNKEFKLIEILSIGESLCETNGIFVVYANSQLSIIRQVVLYDEVKALKFVEQTKLFEDGK